MVHSFDRIGAGQLVDGDDRGRIAVQAPDLVVLLSAQLHPSYIRHADDGAVRVGAHDDVAKLLCVQQTALRPNRVSELLPGGYRLGTDLAGGVHGVLIVERRYDIADRNAQTRQGVGPHPETHRVLVRAEDCYLADSRHTAHRIVDVDVRVVREESGVVGSLGRIEREQRQRAGDRLEDRDTVVAYVDRKLRLGLG